MRVMYPKHLFSQTLSIPLTNVLDESNFVHDLGVDSLDQVELIMACEDE